MSTPLHLPGLLDFYATAGIYLKQEQAVPLKDFMAPVIHKRRAVARAPHLRSTSQAV